MLRCANRAFLRFGEAVTICGMEFVLGRRVMSLYNEPPRTGSCYCGCGGRTNAYFVATHDRIAESFVIKMEYGSIAAFLVAHGYGPTGRMAH